MDERISAQLLAQADSEHVKLMDLIRDLSQAASNLHVVSEYSVTPFFNVMRGFMSGSDSPYLFPGVYESIPLSYFQVAARLWLYQLKAIGVDLVRFGREEKRLHRQCKVDTEWDFCEPETRKDRLFSRQRLLSFTYGSLPRDWIFFMTEAMEWHFREFWDMVDHPEHAMPGAWND